MRLVNFRPSPVNRLVRSPSIDNLARRSFDIPSRDPWKQQNVPTMNVSMINCDPRAVRMRPPYCQRPPVNSNAENSSNSDKTVISYSPFKGVIKKPFSVEISNIHLINTSPDRYIFQRNFSPVNETTFTAVVLFSFMELLNSQYVSPCIKTKFFEICKEPKSEIFSKISEVFRNALDLDLFTKLAALENHKVAEYFMKNKDVLDVFFHRNKT